MEYLENAFMSVFHLSAVKIVAVVWQIISQVSVALNTLVQPKQLSSRSVSFVLEVEHKVCCFSPANLALFR